MATRLIGTDSNLPRLPQSVVDATQGTRHVDLAPGDTLADAKAYTDQAIADVVVGGVDFADNTETITGTSTTSAVTPAGLDYERPYLDVRSFGAVGDGIADDTAAIQAAIDTLTSSFGIPAVEIWLPPGIYKITAKLYVYRKAVHLRGSGVGIPADFSSNTSSKGTTLRWAGPAGQPMLNFFDCKWCLVEDIYFQGNATASPSEGIFFEERSTGGGQGTNEYMVVNRCQFGWMRSDIANYQMDYGIRLGGYAVNNDQFTFNKCVFNQATIAQVKIDNLMSVWGAFYDCVFIGGYSDVHTKGLDAGAQTLLVNPQFNRCTVDITISAACQVQVVGWTSEWSAKLAHLASGAKLVVYGGTMGIRDVVGGYYITCPNAVNYGGLDLNGIQFQGTNAAGRPKIQLIASGATLPAALYIRDCDIQQADLEVTLNNVNSKLLVDIAVDTWTDRSYLTGNVGAYVPPAVATHRIGNALSVGGPVTLPADPTSSLQAATKQYVDTHSGGSVTAPDLLAAGELIPGDDRRTAFAVGNLATTASGSLRLHYFTATRTETITQIASYSGATQAAATPTLCRLGIYQIDGSGNGTLVASTPNTTSLWATANTAYTTALSAAFNKVAGQRYAIGVLVVTAVATPTFTSVYIGATGNTDNNFALAPRIGGALNSQSDLPASFTDASLGVSRTIPTYRLIP